MPAPEDCQTCGVCCFSRLETYVRVTGEDWARLGSDAPRLAQFVGHRAYMKMGEGHCAALEIRRRPAKVAEFFCSVYERRPTTCRELARGSPACEGERTVKHARVGLLVATFPEIITPDAVCDLPNGR